MSVLHVVPYLPQASGVTTFVVECTDELHRYGIPQAIAVNDMSHFDVAESQVEVPRVEIGKALQGMRCGEWDILHIHGIWSPFIHHFVNVAISRSIPIVWSLHGMLAPWAFSSKWWKKLPVWWLWQKRDLYKATVLHATTEMEAGWIREHGFSGRLEIIPLGTHLPKQGFERVTASENSLKTLLFVGRVNRVKALDNLIRAWALVGEDVKSKKWRLRIVGTSDLEYKKSLEDLSEDLRVSNSVVFVGPKYGDDLETEYRNADALVLPSHSENFGGVVIDALARGVPVIASRNTPWQELVRHGCGWWIDNSPERLGDAIGELVNISEADRVLMGQRGKKLVTERYTWEAVVGELRRVYESINNRI